METGRIVSAGNTHGKPYYVTVALLGRVFWCVITSGYFWVLDLLFHPHVESGVIWMVGFAVGLITWQTEHKS